MFDGIIARLRSEPSRLALKALAKCHPRRHPAWHPPPQARFHDEPRRRIQTERSAKAQLPEQSFLGTPQVEIGGGLKYALVQIDCKGTRARARPGTALASQKLVVFSGNNQFSTKLEHISDKPIQSDEFQVQSIATIAQKIATRRDRGLRPLEATTLTRTPPHTSWLP